MGVSSNTEVGIFDNYNMIFIVSDTYVLSESAYWAMCSFNSKMLFITFKMFLIIGSG